MSRNIASKPSISLTEEELEALKTDKNRLLITSYHGKNCALLIEDGQLTEASFFSKEPGKVGAVYIGRVKNLAKNIDACFVEIGKGEICFLPLKNVASPWLLNRPSDGRLLEGDEILVQVVRDAQKGKRASVTANISLANDYFVLTMGETRVGYSSRLSKEKKAAVRKLFREQSLFDLNENRDCLVQNCERLLSETERQSGTTDGIRPKFLNLPMTGLIVRTKMEETESAEELLQHFYALSAQYIGLLYSALHRSCFTCLKEADTDLEMIFNHFSLDTIHNLEIVTDRKDIYERLLQKIRKMQKTDDPTEGIRSSEEKIHFSEDNSKENCLIGKRMCPETDCPIRKGTCPEIRFYQDDMLSLSGLYSVDKKLADALESRVWLKSGAYLVIESTEALTVIDVNSGKYESEKDAHDTYLKINLEAAGEVARQLRLRNLSGIIIVDFINMQLPADKRELLQYLKALVSRDRIPTNVVDITALGLVEITRKKINRPLQEQFSETQD